MEPDWVTMYIPEPIPGAQAIQYMDWPSFDYMLFPL